MLIHAQMVDQTRRNAVYVERLKAEQGRKLAEFLADVDRDLRKRIAGKDLTAFSRGRMDMQIRYIEQSMLELFGVYYAGFEKDMKEIAQYQAEFEAKSLNAILVSATAATPAAAQVMSAVFTNPMGVRGPGGGKILESFVKDYAENEIETITGAIKRGYFEGQTTAQVLTNIRGTKAGGYRDGLLGRTDRNLNAVVRTGLQHTANTARMETLKENSDIAPRYQWESMLDSKTSRQCRSLDGLTFIHGKGPVPPGHANCRSTILPVLSEKYAYLMEGETRVSKGSTYTGPVDGNQTYYEWLKKQSPEFQKSAIKSPTLQAVFEKGGLSAERFAQMNVGRDFQPLSISEMRKLEPLAFKRSGV